MCVGFFLYFCSALAKCLEQKGASFTVRGSLPFPKSVLILGRSFLKGRPFCFIAIKTVESFPVSPQSKSSDIETGIFARRFNLYAVHIVKGNDFVRNFAPNFDFALKLQHRYIMKKLFSFLLILFVGFTVYAAEPDSLLLASNSSSEPIDKEHCTCKGIPLYGKVKVVSSGADFKVQVVDTWEDLDVVVVTEWADSCGKWKFVDEKTSWYDFTIEYVSSWPDFKVKFVNTWAGTK